MEILVLHYDYELNEYDHVATVRSPAEYGTKRSLEYAYRYTQNIGGSWSAGEKLIHDGDTYCNPDYNENVTVLKPLMTIEDREYGHRSTMIGDRMIIETAIFSVDALGFSLINEKH